MHRFLPFFWLLALALLTGVAIRHLVLRKPGGPPGARHTVASRLEQYGGAARARLRPAFERAGVGYPPPRMTWLALKDERRLEIHAPDAAGAMRLVKAYQILGASGKPGPKLREGDRQVPEGFYKVESLNPNSAYHLSLRVNYPSPFDLGHARAEGRTEPGGDIMIHGATGSVGCLAMGDEASEDFFVLAADSGLGTISILIAPHDFRGDPSTPRDVPDWMPAVYERLREEMESLPAR